MKTVNLFKSNLSGKQLISEKSATKKAVADELKNYANVIDSAFQQVIKSTDQRARNVANAAKGKYQTSLQVIAHCFPYQTKEGVLCTKRTNEEGVKVWAEKKLTAAAARGIVRDSLKCFTDGIGTPAVKIVVIGETCEKKAEKKAEKGNK